MLARRSGQHSRRSSARFVQSSAFDAGVGGYTLDDDLCLIDGAWNEPYWSAYGADLETLDVGIPSYDLHSHEENGFVLEAGDIVDDPLQGYLPEHEQEASGLLPFPFTYDHSSLPADIVAQVDSHPTMRSPFPAPTMSHGPQFPPAHAFNIASPSILSVPLPEAESCGRIEDAPQTVMPLGDGKRSREEEEDTPRTPRPSKKSKGLRSVSRTTPSRPVAENHRASRTVAVPRPASPVAGPSNLRGAVSEPVDESDADSDTDNDEDHAHDGTGAAGIRTKRARRTKVQVAAVTRTDLQKVHCPVNGCTTMFDPLTHDANRKHLKLHYPEGALDNNASLPCLWAGCMMRKGKGKPWTQTRKPGTTMITHLHKDHVGRAYTCPVEGCTTWASSRSGDLPQHLARNHKGWRPP